MTSVQKSKLNMYNAVTAYCDANTAITATIPAFDTVLIAFKAEVTALDTTAQLEAEVISGITISKADLKKSTASSGAGLAAALYAYAVSINDAVLQQKANYSYSDLLKLRDDELTIIAQNIHDEANNVMAFLAPYGVTAAILTAFQNLLDDYNSNVPSTRNAVAQRKAYKDQLITLFSEADNLLNNQLDKIALQFKTSQPDFYMTYKNNRKIVNAPTSNTQAVGTITDSSNNNPIVSATVEFEGTGLTTTSDIDGAYTLKNPNPGIYTITFTKAGYQNYQVPNIELTLGQSNTIDAQLVPAV